MSEFNLHTSLEQCYAALCALQIPFALGIAFAAQLQLIMMLPFVAAILLWKLHQAKYCTALAAFKQFLVKLLQGRQFQWISLPSILAIYTWQYGNAFFQTNYACSTKKFVCQEIHVVYVVCFCADAWEHAAWTKGFSMNTAACCTADALFTCCCSLFSSSINHDTVTWWYVCADAF